MVKKREIMDHFTGRRDTFYRHPVQSELKPVKANGDMRRVCPPHDDTDPSLVINRQTGEWYCRGEKTARSGHETGLGRRVLVHGPRVQDKSTTWTL